MYRVLSNVIMVISALKASPAREVISLSQFQRAMKTKVLYVEDEPFLGRIVKESLESRDFEVTMLTDGRSVKSTFEKVRPDICVFDIMLPVKDGYSISKEIRQINPSTPIIFVTAKTQTEDLLKGFESGGNDYIKKPFSME